MQGSLDLKPYSLEFRIIRRDGEVRWMFCNVTIVTLPEVNEPVHLATINDTTDLHRAKEKEEEAAK